MTQERLSTEDIVVRPAPPGGSSEDDRDTGRTDPNPDAGQAEGDRSEGGRADADRGEMQRGGTAGSDLGGSDAGRADLSRDDTGRPDLSRDDTGGPGMERPDIERPDGEAPGGERADTGRADLARSDMPRDDTGRPDTGRRDDNAPLLDEGESTEFLRRWSEAQARFVDDPRGAVRDGDSLVAELVQAVAQRFSQHKSGLEEQWSRGAEPGTEELRVAMQQYRSFFQRLLAT